MKGNRYWAAVSWALATVTIPLVVISMLTPGAWACGKYRVIHRFTGDKGGDGMYPRTGLLFDAAGNLYGTTPYGGTWLGTAFRLAPNADGSWTENTLHNFEDNGDGINPISNLISDTAGNLYGVTYRGVGSSTSCDHGCGTVFMLTPNADGSWSHSVLYNFPGGHLKYPLAGMVFDASGNLYGTTHGTPGNVLGKPYGAVFMLQPSTGGVWNLTVLHYFKGTDGSNPYARLALDPAGNLYGTTESGGAFGHGVVFKLAPSSDDSWKETVLHAFTGGDDGGGPESGVTIDSQGNLFGVTGHGGAYKAGVAYQLIPSSGGKWKERIIHAFTRGKDGGVPVSDLIFDTDGNLYGTTVGGGYLEGSCAPDGCGMVFKLAPDESGHFRETALHRFRGGTGGSAPLYGSLIFGAAGHLYGTASNGGIGKCALGCGVVFEITP